MRIEEIEVRRYFSVLATPCQLYPGQIVLAEQFGRLRRASPRMASRLSLPISEPTLGHCN